MKNFDAKLQNYSRQLRRSSGNLRWRWKLAGLAVLLPLIVPSGLLIGALALWRCRRVDVYDVLAGAVVAAAWSGAFLYAVAATVASVFSRIVPAKKTETIEERK